MIDVGVADQHCPQLLGRDPGLRHPQRDAAAGVHEQLWLSVEEHHVAR